MNNMKKSLEEQSQKIQKFNSKQIALHEKNMTEEDLNESVSEMKSLLTKQDIKYLLEQQEKLDRDIRKEHGISDTEWKLMDDEHEIALRVEVAEFVNACYKSWKYWKKKTMDRQAILDEAVDVIHFLMLGWNKEDLKNEALTYVTEYFNDVEVVKSQRDAMKCLKAMLVVDNALDTLSYLLIVLDFYDFDRKQIMQAYKDKNKVNFERLAGGY